MYKVINPNPENHKYTFVLLHSMCSDDSQFNEFIDYFKTNDNYDYIFKYIKFIFPISPIIDIDYPDNKLFNQNAWYNYYTCYDGKNKVDDIDENQFNYQTKIITEIVNQEANILGNYKNIYIGGESQGGTLIFNILNNLPKNIGGLFCLRSIYMHKYIKLNKKYNKTPIFIYSGTLDNVYTLKLQKKCFKCLEKKCFKIEWTIIENLNHYNTIEKEYNFIINSFIKTLLK